jgi:hypothetical protein
MAAVPQNLEQARHEACIRSFSEIEELSGRVVLGVLSLSLNESRMRINPNTNQHHFPVKMVDVDGSGLKFDVRIGKEHLFDRLDNDGMLPISALAKMLPGENEDPDMPGLLISKSTPSSMAINAVRELSVRTDFSYPAEDFMKEVKNDGELNLDLKDILSKVENKVSEPKADVDRPTLRPR